MTAKKTAGPLPSAVMDLVESTPVTNEAEATALNDRVLEMTRRPLQRPVKPKPITCSTDRCELVAVIQEARDCDGCEASEQHGDPHSHPLYSCKDHREHS